MSAYKKTYDLTITGDRRKERNIQLLAKLENIEKKAAFLQAKTDRIKSLKTIYKSQFKNNEPKNSKPPSKREVNYQKRAIIGDGYHKEFYNPYFINEDYFVDDLNQPHYVIKNISLEEAIEEISKRFILIPKGQKKSSIDKTVESKNNDVTTDLNESCDDSRESQDDEGVNKEVSTAVEETQYKDGNENPEITLQSSPPSEEADNVAQKEEDPPRRFSKEKIIPKDQEYNEDGIETNTNTDTCNETNNSIINNEVSTFDINTKSDAVIENNNISEVVHFDESPKESEMIYDNEKETNELQYSQDCQNEVPNPEMNYQPNLQMENIENSNYDPSVEQHENYQYEGSYNDGVIEAYEQSQPIGENVYEYNQENVMQQGIESGEILTNETTNDVNNQENVQYYDEQQPVSQYEGEASNNEQSQYYDNTYSENTYGDQQYNGYNENYDNQYQANDVNYDNNQTEQVNYDYQENYEQNADVTHENQNAVENDYTGEQNYTAEQQENYPYEASQVSEEQQNINYENSTGYSQEEQYNESQNITYDQTSYDQPGEENQYSNYESNEAQNYEGGHEYTENDNVAAKPLEIFDSETEQITREETSAQESDFDFSLQQ